MVRYYFKALVIICINGRTCIWYGLYGNGMSLWFLAHSQVVANDQNEHFAAVVLAAKSRCNPLHSLKSAVLKVATKLLALDVCCTVFPNLTATPYFCSGWPSGKISRAQGALRILFPTFPPSFLFLHSPCSVLNCINRPFSQKTCWRVTAEKAVDYKLNNGWIPFSCAGFQGETVTYWLLGRSNRAEPLLKLFYAFPSMTGQNVCCETVLLPPCWQWWTGEKVEMTKTGIKLSWESPSRDMLL